MTTPRYQDQIKGNRNLYYPEISAGDGLVLIYRYANHHRSAAL